MKSKLIFATIYLTSQISFAAQSLSTKISHHYDSMRALGMGNAFTAVADDYSLIYYNPAGFANKKANEVQFSFVGAGISAKTLTLVKDIDQASKTAGDDQAKAQAISDVLEQYYGKTLGGKLQAAEMFWVRKNWGVSLIPIDLSIDMTIDRQLGPSIDLNVKGDSTLAYGYGTNISDYISVGATAKFVHRVSVEQSVSALELASDSNVLSSKRFKEGQLIDFDLGVLWRPNWFGYNVVKVEKKLDAKSTEAKPLDNQKVEDKQSEDQKSEERKPQAEDVAAVVDGNLNLASSDTTQAVEKTEPVEKPKEVQAQQTETAQAKENLPLTFGLVVHNVLGGNFNKSKMINKDAIEAPTKMYRVIDFGTQYVLSELGDLTIRSMIDFRDMMHPEITFNKSFHAGLEFDYSPSGWFKSQLRGGLNQMYYTAGATLLLGIVNIDLVTYGEEVGSTSTKIENRVYAAKVGMNF